MRANVQKTYVDLPKKIGRGYGAFMKSTHRYLVCKGGRASKKSYTAAYKLILNLMKFPSSNALVLRRYDTTNKDSTYAQLQLAINLLEVSHLWKGSLSPLSLTYLPTGQKIIFRGLDNPQSITSVTFSQGQLCFVWIEEAFQVENEEDFNKLDLSLRGQVNEPGLYKQIIITFNPWEQHHWLKRRFFDSDDPDVLAMTTTYQTNEFLGEDDLALFEKMKLRDPKRYKVEGLGEWGILGGNVYENWEVKDFDVWQLRNSRYNLGRARYIERYGLDLGFSEDPVGLVGMLIDTRENEIYIHTAIKKYHLNNVELATLLKEEVYNNLLIRVDSAEARTISELKSLGVSNLQGVKKGPNSVMAGIRTLQGFKIYVHPSCTDFIRELEGYHFKIDRYTNEPLPEVEKANDHLMDAFRYGAYGIRSMDFSWAPAIL